MFTHQVHQCRTCAKLILLKKETILLILHWFHTEKTKNFALSKLTTSSYSLKSSWRPVLRHQQPWGCSVFVARSSGCWCSGERSSQRGARLRCRRRAGQANKGPGDTEGLLTIPVDCCTELVTNEGGCLSCCSLILVSCQPGEMLCDCSTEPCLGSLTQAPSSDPCRRVVMLLPAPLHSSRMT